MLTVLLEIKTPKRLKTVTAAVWNTSNLAALSEYDFALVGRRNLNAEVLLRGYPRWSESTRGLLARCIALTEPKGTPASRLPLDWERVTVTTGIRAGGRGANRPLSMATVAKGADGTLEVGFAEDIGLTGFHDGLVAPEKFADGWDAAQYALCMSAFGSRVLPPMKALDIPVYEAAGHCPYIRTGDISEPTRSIFERQMVYSGRPAIAGAKDAVFAWDWTAFLNGNR